MNINKQNGTGNQVIKVLGYSGATKHNFLNEYKNKYVSKEIK